SQNPETQATSYPGYPPQHPYAAQQPYPAHGPYVEQNLFPPEGGYDPNHPDFRAFCSKRTVAGICGILWGAFGVHKYILGMTTSGTIMLSVFLVSLFLGGCLTVPLLGCLVIWIIGIIEGIVYLTKSDQEFYHEYAVRRKEWF
ncbi:MAG: hypothetical protein AAFP69_16745, partial [Planctomycetota bacterium]